MLAMHHLLTPMTIVDSLCQMGCFDIKVVVKGHLRESSRISGINIPFTYLVTFHYVML